MARLLGIAFSESQLGLIAGFAASLDLPHDAILFDGTSTATSAETVYVAKETTADVAAKAIQAMAGPYSHIVAVSSMAAKDLLPRVAALLDGAMVTDVTEVLGPNLFKRAIHAGSAIATVETQRTPVIATFRPSGFESPKTGTQPKTESLDIPSSPNAKVTTAAGHKGSRPDLSQAKFVISGGRPLRDAETFEKLIGGFADEFGGAVGATRAAVDAGIAPNECQVGQTGQIVAPDLYIAAGISGSTQHMAGVRDSKLIVAINKDPEAPIFALADFGIVGDLYEVLPALQANLKASQGNPSP